MAKSRRRTRLVAALAAAAFVAVVSLASADSTLRPGVKNGVITACVEPLTQGQRFTSGDLNFIRCAGGAKQVSWNIRGRRGLIGPRGATGPQGATGRDRRPRCCGCKG